MFFCLRNTHRQKTILSEFLSRVVINMYIYLLIIIVTATKLFHVSVHAYHLQRITKRSDYLIYVVHVTCYQFLYSVFCFVQLLLIRFPLILPYFDPAQKLNSELSHNHSHELSTDIDIGRRTGYTTDASQNFLKITCIGRRIKNVGEKKA